MSNTNYSLGINKPLIKNENDYVLDRRLLTVHSVDRDITKWQDSNTFELLLPEALINVQSMRLVQITLPSHIYVFSNANQNTKLIFYIGGGEYPITIDEGNYTGNELAYQLQQRIRTAITETLIDVFVFYNPVNHKFYFGTQGTQGTEFKLLFNRQITYENNCNNPLMWCYYANWGLPYYLGFSKKEYISSNSNVPKFYYNNNDTESTWNDNVGYYITSDFASCLQGEHAIYMEVEKYNNCYDEVYPYNQSSKEILNNNAYNGRVNSAFAKIPLYRNLGQPTLVDSHSLYLQTMVQYDPPLERLARLKFKFRYHDGRLVDFQNCEFDFTIELNCLRNEISKKYNIRVPPTYSL